MEEKKAIAMSLVTASETDIEQTESRIVICVEMWCNKGCNLDLFFKSVEFYLEF